MAEAGKQLIETTNKWIDQSTKFEIALRETADGDKETADVCKKVAKGLQHLENKTKDTQLQTQKYLLNFTENSPKPSITEMTGEKCEQITRDVRGRATTSEDDSAYYSKDSNAFDSKILQSVEINLNEAVGGEEHSETSVETMTMNMSLHGRLISQCSGENDQTNLEAQTNETASSIASLDIVDDYFKV